MCNRVFDDFKFILFFFSLIVSRVSKNNLLKIYVKSYLKASTQELSEIKILNDSINFYLWNKDLKAAWCH